LPTWNGRQRTCPVVHDIVEWCNSAHGSMGAFLMTMKPTPEH
jgi:hypothetical protein